MFETQRVEIKRTEYCRLVCSTLMWKSDKTNEIITKTSCIYLLGRQNSCTWVVVKKLQIPRAVQLHEFDGYGHLAKLSKAVHLYCSTGEPWPVGEVWED